MSKSVILLQSNIVIQDGNTRYEDTLANLALDYSGSPIPSLPAGKTQWVYQQGYSSVQWTDSNAEQAANPWDDGDALITAIDDIITAKTARLAPAPPTLEEYKVTVRQAIDMSAESARLRYVTSGSGQAMTYQEKGEEAADYAAAGYPPIGSPVDYPFVNADAIAYGITPHEAADQILALRSAWVAIGAQVEQIRLSGKNAVTAAVDEGEVDTARDAAIAALNAI